MIVRSTTRLNAPRERFVVEDKRTLYYYSRPEGPAMRSILCFVAFTAFAGCSFAQEDAPADPPPEDVVAFVGVDVVPMDAERVLADHTVVVRGDRIVEVGPAETVAVPEGALTIDGDGRWLAPGLAEMHGHVPSRGFPAGLLGGTPFEQWVDDVLFLWVANGVTTVRGMLGGEGQLELREAVRAGERLGPTLYLAGPSFNGNSVTSPGQAEAMVRRQAREGWDLLKVHPGLTREEYDAMARTAREVGIRFGGHVPEDVGIVHALEMGLGTVEHMDGYIRWLDGEAGVIPEERLEEAVALTKRHGAWIVPTQSLWETLWGVPEPDDLTGRDELKYVPRPMVEAWAGRYRERRADPGRDLEVSRRVVENRRRLLAKMNNGGAQILMGTDSPQMFSVPGFSLHREVRAMAGAGMTPFEIVSSGSRAVGQYFAKSDLFGLVAPGHRADLVLYDENPLEDVEHLARVEGVMVRGRWLSEETIEAGLEAIEARYGE